MATRTMPTAELDTADWMDKRLDLVRRFTLASFADTALFDTVPQDVLLFLLPDDSAFVARESAAGAESARRDRNVYFQHVRVTDLSA